MWYKYTHDHSRFFDHLCGAKMMQKIVENAQEFAFMMTNYFEAATPSRCTIQIDGSGRSKFEHFT